jgi:hypothetical protein
VHEENVVAVARDPSRASRHAPSIDTAHRRVAADRALGRTSAPRSGACWLQCPGFQAGAPKDAAVARHASSSRNTERRGGSETRSSAARRARRHGPRAEAARPRLRRAGRARDGGVARVEVLMRGGLPRAASARRRRAPAI